jgi:hypothetical protein
MSRSGSLRLLGPGIVRLFCLELQSCGLRIVNMAEELSSWLYSVVCVEYLRCVR